MDLSSVSEFAEEYQDWLDGLAAPQRVASFDVPLAQLEPEPALAIEPETSLREAITRMNQHDRGALLVVSEERLVGIFSERDLLARVRTSALDLDRVKVADAMSIDPEVLSDSTSVAQALCAMLRSRHGYLPVVDASGRPLAMVSMRRLLQFVAEVFASEIANAPPEPNSGVFAVEGA